MIFDGRSPITGLDVVQIQVHDGKLTRQVGWDISISDPKSVSAVWAVGDRATRLAIDAIRREVIDKVVLPYIEGITNSRRGKGGHIVEPAKPVIAVISHGTSRELDPQTNEHIVVANVGVRADGTTGTIMSQPFYDHQGAINALYLAETSRLYGERLGLQCEKVRSWFELKGVPESLREEWSKRQHEIDQAVGDRASSSPGAREAAALSTRSPKDRSQTPDELRQRWVSEAARHGFTAETVRDLLGHQLTSNPERAARGGLDAALTKLSETQAHFTRQDL
jgi:conjugative relaxase-like TrwC/TraI family protein